MILYEVCQYQYSILLYFDSCLGFFPYFLIGYETFCQVSFKIVGGTLSGLTIDPKSVSYSLTFLFHSDGLCFDLN